LKFSLENLARNGIDHALIVTGYKNGMIQDHVGSSYAGVQVHYVEDQHPIGSMGSLDCVSVIRPFSVEDVLILESDLLYEPDAIRFLREAPERDVMMSAPLSGSGDEVYMCVDERGYLLELGKNVADRSIAIGELVGTTKLSPKFLSEVYLQADHEFMGGVNGQHYEEVIAQVAQRLPVKVLHHPLIWMEIDTERDYRRAVEEVYPKLKAKLDQGEHK
jgi:2-aminoethylphosphonate-pyruvate transaminase